MKSKAVYDFLDFIAPFNTASEWDNCGLLVGSVENDGTKTKWFDISYIVINLCYYLDKFIEIKNFEILIPYIIGVLIGYVILKFYCFFSCEFY